MFQAIVFVNFILMTALAGAQVSSRCSPTPQGEATLSKTDFTDLIDDEAEARSIYQATYEDPRRYQDRVYWSTEEASYVFKAANRTVKVPDIFIRSLIRHIETAMERSYAEYLYYPDMGHAHLEIPKDADPVDTDPAGGFEKLLSSKNLKFLFHTAELFKLRKDFTGPLLGDDWWKWRYFSRNLIGDNLGGEDLHLLFSKETTYNTVREIEGHRERARIYMSANRNGCFSFTQNGEAVYFDIRFE